MAQTTTSAPQQQTPMPAVDLRQLLGSLVSAEGVRTSTDLAVAQRAAGANMSVDVAAGSAVIQDDHASGGGFYSYTLAATTNVAVTGSDPTNPRVDRVVVRVRDQALGDAANDATVVVVAGTPTSGATLVNLNGAATVPGSSLLLANVLVPNASSSVTTANIANVAAIVSTVAARQVGARVYHNAAQSTTSGAAFVLAFNSERFDTDVMHDTATNNSRITIVVPGRYKVDGNAEFAASGTGVRELHIRVNGVTTVAKGIITGSAADPVAVTVSTVYDFAANDYVELLAKQDSGGALNVNSTGNYSPEFSAVRA